MFFVGIDLHKKTITLCVVNQQRQVWQRQTLHCSEPEKIRRFFAELGPFQAVVEATASYEWLWQLLEPLAERLVLAHPKKLRIIAESTRKSDRLDAQVLAEFLALGMIPEAYRPTPRQRQQRVLVRQRCYLRKQITALKNKLRRILSNYNADRKDLFSAEGLAYLAEIKVLAVDRVVIDQLRGLWEYLEKQLAGLDQELRSFARQAPVREQEARAVLESIPGVGAVTVDVVLAEVGDVQRFRSEKRVASYAGLAPGQRESAGRSKELGISKEGSRLLRWALVEAAWRLVRHSQRWQRVYEQLCKRRGKKKAIVAVARRLLGVMVALLRSGQAYRLAS
jgi:transposase